MKLRFRKEYRNIVPVVLFMGLQTKFADVIIRLSHRTQIHFNAHRVSSVEAELLSPARSENRGASYFGG